MQQGIHERARHPQDEHRGTLTNQPLTHSNLRSLQRSVQAIAAFRSEERKKPAIGSFALQNEVDGQNDPRNKFHDPARQILGGKQQVARCLTNVILNLGIEVIGVHSIQERNMPESLQERRRSRWRLHAKLLKIPDDWRESQKTESCERSC